MANFVVSESLEVHCVPSHYRLWYVCLFAKVCLQFPCYECTIHFDCLHTWVCPMHSVYCQCSNVIVLWKWVSFFVITYEV